MDHETDSGDQEEQPSGTRQPGHPFLRTTGSAYRNSDSYSLGPETRHEMSWRNDRVSRGVFGGQPTRNNLTWNRSSHTAAPTAGSWRNVSREASGGARPKESNTSWRRNNSDKDEHSRTQIDRQETSNPRRRADSQREGTTEQPSNPDSRISHDFFRRPGNLVRCPCSIINLTSLSLSIKYCFSLPERRASSVSHPLLIRLNTKQR